MISVPLFGKDSIPHRTSNFFGLIGTVLLLLIFLLCMILIPVGRKKPLKPVTIVLDSTPKEKRFIPEEKASTSPNASENEFTEVVEKTVAETPVEQQIIEQIVEQANQSAPEPVIEPIPVPVEQSVAVPVIPEPTPVPQPKTVEDKPKPVEKKIEKPKKVEPVSKSVETPAPAKMETVPVKEAAPVEEIQLSKSVEELMAEQMSTKTASKPAFDWSMFDDDETSDNSTQSTNTPKKVMEANKLEGNSGNVVQNKTETKTTATKTSEKFVENNVSTKTSQNLSKIQNTTNYKSTSGGSEGTVKASTIKDGSGKTLMTMSSGSARSLLDPPEPVVNLSSENGAKITSDVTVTIEFYVLAGGNIGKITITPESVLPESVRKEILNQIAFWRFESSDSVDTGKFEYTIKKK